MANLEKAAKVAFVTGHLGGTVSEINQVSVLLWSVLQSKLSLFTPYTAPACFIDFLLNCAAILFATTLYSSSPLFLNLLLLLPATVVLMSSSLPGKRKSHRRTELSPDKLTQGNNAQNQLPVKAYITAYRGTMLVVTCVAILAVDFNVFPRRFAKVENWGTSLMDLGVGSFVFSAGTVSVRSILKQQLENKSQSLGTRLVAAFRRCLPLLVLGFIRLYTVKGLDYAEHVTEYGVHWNFFFTMALIAPIVALFDFAFGLLPSYAAFALLVGIGYEALLEFTDLKAYIMTAPRNDLLSKNREGLFSFIGYLAIFLTGQAIGINILPRENTGKSFRESNVGKLLLWSSIWTLLFMFSTNYKFGINLQVSRRLANLPYFLWVAAFNCVQLTLFCIIEKVCFPGLQGTKSDEKNPEACSRLLQAFNRNGLAIFLSANLLTGLINMALPTLAMSDLQAMAILLGYCAVLSGVALLLESKGISVKF